MSNKFLILYHKEDNDGLFSMSIIYNYLVNEEHINPSDIEIYGAGYNDIDSLNVKYICDSYSHIYLTDISFNDHNKLIELYKQFGDNMIWFDHHTPIIQASRTYHFDSCKGLRDERHSALYNAFAYLYKKHVPLLFKYLSAYDSFTFEKEGYDKEFVTNINTGVYNKYDLNINKIIDLVHNIIYNNEEVDIDELESIGKFESEIFKRFHKNIIESHGDFTWKVNNKPACALFMQGPSYSYMFDSVKDKVKHGIVFKHLPNGKWTLSLYNTNDNDTFHCGEYLRENYQGGGHQGAAGAQIAQETFIKLLTSKNI